MSEGDGQSTPRGDAELVDFDALDRLEAVQPVVGQDLARAPEADLSDERLSGPKQWEQWFSEKGHNAMRQERAEQEHFADYIKECEWELIANGTRFEEELSRRRAEYEEHFEELGTSGALMEVGDDSGGRSFIADAVNAVFLEMHLHLAEITEEGPLILRLATLQFLLSLLLRCLFPEQSASLFEELARLLRAPKLGMAALVARLTPQSAASARTSIDARFAKIAKVLRRLLDSVVPGDESWPRAAADEAQASFALLAGLLTEKGCPAWPEVLLLFRTAVLRTCNHTQGRGLGAVVRTSPREIVLLLRELRSAFRDGAFQEKYQKLREQAKRGESQTHGAMLAMTYRVQCSVVPKYGFAASPAGVMAMFDESDFHADFVGARCSGDKVVAYLRLHVCQALSVEVKQDWNFGGRKFEHQPQFHTVGDSHSTVGWPAYVNRHFQGPLLCYNVHRVDVRELSPPVQAGDCVCFCFGEIDCRVQVHKRCCQGVTYQQVIDGIVRRYFDHLGQQQRLLPAGARLLVFNVPPPQYKSVLERTWIGIPCSGEDEERRSYVVYFNSRLEEECRRHAIQFFDVYEKYTDEHGFLAAKYSDETVHIADGCFMEEFIKALRLKPVRKNQTGLNEE